MYGIKVTNYLLPVSFFLLQARTPTPTISPTKLLPLWGSTG